MHFQIPFIEMDMNLLIVFNIVHLFALDQRIIHIHTKEYTKIFCRIHVFESNIMKPFYSIALSNVA